MTPTIKLIQTYSKVDLPAAVNDAAADGYRLAMASFDAVARAYNVLMVRTGARKQKRKYIFENIERGCEKVMPENTELRGMLNDGVYNILIYEK